MISDQLTRWMYRGGRPNALARAMNDVSAALHAVGIAPNYLVTLQVSGRRSRRPIAFPLVMVVCDGDRYLVSMLGSNVSWVRNLRAADGYALLRHGRTEHVQSAGGRRGAAGSRAESLPATGTARGRTFR